jgi:hypothetical protein
MKTYFALFAIAVAGVAFGHGNNADTHYEGEIER